MEDEKKYIKMENVLNTINRKYIALPEHEVKRNNRIVDQVVGDILMAMKKQNPLFKTMFERKFYGGSFYDGIKVGKPIEFDLDFVLNLPVLIKPVVEVGDKPGFVQVRITEFDKLLNQPEQYRKYEKLKPLFDDKMFLSTEKVLRWMERTVNLALNELGKSKDGTVRFNVKLPDKNLVMYASVTKCHPAFTLNLISEDGSIKLDIDLVPCFQFGNTQWPKGQYRRNPMPQKRDKFLVVPKKPKPKCQNIDRYWRLSFQEQERELIGGCQNNTLKPALRLLKKLRDKHSHPIASYHIKTVFLWQVSELEPEKWRQPLSKIFMMMLKKYADMVKNKCIPYYWNKNFNMIGHFSDVTLNDIANTLANIIKIIDRYVDEDPFVVAKYLIEPPEIEKLRREPDVLGKKVLKKIASMTNSASQQSSPSILDKTYASSALAAMSSLNTSATSNIDIAKLLRDIGADIFKGATVTSSNKGSSVKSTSEAGSTNGSQISNVGSNDSVRSTSNDVIVKTSCLSDILSQIPNESIHSLSKNKVNSESSHVEAESSNSKSSKQVSDESGFEIIPSCLDTKIESGNNLNITIVNNISSDADAESSDSNSDPYSLGQLTDKSSVKIIPSCLDTKFESGNGLHKNIVNNVSSDADAESSDSNSDPYSLRQISDESNIKTIPGYDCIDTGTENGSTLNKNSVIHNDLPEAEVGTSSTEKINNLDSMKDDKSSCQKLGVISDDGFQSGDSSNASYVSDSINKVAESDSFDKNIFIALEKLYDKTDVMSNVLKRFEDGQEVLFNLCSKLTEKVQHLEDRVDTMEQSIKAKNKYIPVQSIPHVSCIDSPYEDSIVDRLEGNLKEGLEQLNKKTDSLCDSLKILQESNEKLVTICQPLSGKVHTLERKIDNLNKDVKPENKSNLEDLLLFGSSLTPDSYGLESDLFTGGY